MKKEIMAPVGTIESKIYIIREKRVMLDRDLAKLYAVRSIALRQQLKRNKERFPTDFAYRLTKKEVMSLVSQNVIPSWKYLGGTLPYVFTEHGALMLANVLKSTRAMQMSVEVVRAFVRAREMLATHKELRDKIEKMEEKYDGQFKIVFDAIKQLITPPGKPKSKIGFHVK